MMKNTWKISALIVSVGLIFTATPVQSGVVLANPDAEQPSANPFDYPESRFGQIPEQTVVRQQSDDDSYSSFEGEGGEANRAPAGMVYSDPNGSAKAPSAAQWKRPVPRRIQQFGTRSNSLNQKLDELDHGKAEDGTLYRPGQVENSEQVYRPLGDPQSGKPENLIPEKQKGVQEVALIAGDLGFFPKTVFVTQDIPVRVYLTSASMKTLCVMIDTFNVKRQVKAQEIQEVTFTPNMPGKYRFYCPVNGMEGTMVVKEPVAMTN